MENSNKFDVLAHVSEEQAAVLKWQDEQHKDAFNTVDLELAEIRANYEAERVFWNEGGPVMAKAVVAQVPYEDYTVRCRLHYPSLTPNNAFIIFSHGGGNVVGSIDTHDRMMRVLAEESGCVVIGVDMSLAPEKQFPTGILEVIAAADYFREHAAEYDLDADRMGFAGDSGGAMLSMGAFLWMRDHREDTSYVRAMLLYYGTYGMRDGKSFRLYGGIWDGLTEEDFAFYNALYCKPEERNSPYICYYNNNLYTRMAPCFIATAEFDPLVDDGECLYEILKDKGVPCEYKMYEGTIHAFLHYSKMMKASTQCLRDSANFFKKYI